VRILYYTHSAFFELALCLVRELSAHAEVHLLLEMSPTAWQSAAFDLPPRPIPSGIVPADGILADAFPAGVRAYWQSAASFHLVAHSSRHSLDPSAWRLSRAVLAFAMERGIEVMHLDDVDVSPRLALGLPGGTHPPIAIAVHDPEPHSGEHNWRRWLARRLAFPSASRFVLYNDVSRERFATRSRVPPGIIDVTRLGRYDVFRAWSRPHRDDASPMLLFFGRLSPYKGLETLYAALPAIAARVPGVRIVVAGQPIRGYVPPRAPDLGPHARVEVIDRYVSNSEVAELFQQATVVACPYHDATQSGVVLTAFAFDVPVVASAVGGMAEYVIANRTGLLVPPGDPPALAEAVARLLVDAALRSRLSAGIEEAAARELSWRQTVETLMHTYSECRLQPPRLG
jgi:glycosyltransferase involved in cell wall biosynthesis